MERPTRCSHSAGRRSRPRSSAERPGRGKRAADVPRDARRDRAGPRQRALDAACAVLVRLRHHPADHHREGADVPAVAQAGARPARCRPTACWAPLASGSPRFKGARQGGAGATSMQSSELRGGASLVRQVESTVAMQTLQPRIKEIQERYKGRPQDEMQAGRPRVGPGFCEAMRASASQRTCDVSAVKPGRGSMKPGRGTALGACADQACAVVHPVIVTSWHGGCAALAPRCQQTCYYETSLRRVSRARRGAGSRNPSGPGGCGA